MKVFRHIFAKRIFTMIAGLTFLNMSFFLAEVVILGIDKNSSLVRNFVTSGFEEEKETSSESSEVDESKVFLSLSENLFRHNILFISGSNRDKIFHNVMTDPGHKKIFSPPPEFRSTI